MNQQYECKMVMIGRSTLKFLLTQKLTFKRLKSSYAILKEIVKNVKSKDGITVIRIVSTVEQLL